MVLLVMEKFMFYDLIELSMQTNRKIVIMYLFKVSFSFLARKDEKLLTIFSMIYSLQNIPSFFENDVMVILQCFSY